MSLWLSSLLNDLLKAYPFQSPVKKNKFQSFHDTAKRTEVSNRGKIKSAKVNRYILGTLTSFSVQFGKVINYEKALPFPFSPILLNIASADGSRLKTKKSKLKDIIIENSNLRTDENLYELSRCTAIVDVMPVLNSEEFIANSVEYLLKEFGKAELIVDSCRTLSLKRKEQEGRQASGKLQTVSAKSKVAGIFHLHILRNSGNKKRLLELILPFF